MVLYSYVVARDYGFAPNPFYGFCTLATCKPRIRQRATAGDWIVGTGSSNHQKSGYLVYVMCVTETMPFDNYWSDSRFFNKKPNLRASKKQAYGDNIYHKDKYDQWHQIDSHHSYENGVPNLHNIQHDTQIDRILVSNNYIYWGKFGPKLPMKFRNQNGVDICKRGPGHKSNFPQSFIDEFISWIQSLNETGYIGKPSDW